MKKIFFYLCTFCFNTIFAQQRYSKPLFEDKDRIQKVLSSQSLVDDFFKEHKAENNYPSLAYGILLDGKLIFSGATGNINIDKNIPADKNALYRIASMSKSVTALCILQLRDAGKLKLDDPAYNYIPQIKKSKLLTTDAPPITIRHLLSHAAGFPEDNPWGDRQLDDSNAELMALINRSTYFSNVPGIHFEYSNLGFALLGAIVEKVSGMSLEKYSKDKIFKPLGMLHTEWEYSKIPADKLALGYRWTDEKWQVEELLHHGSYGAMGGLITSIEDFSKYISLHMSAWPPRSEAENVVLKRSSLREMHMPSTISGFNPGFRYPSGRVCGVMSTYNCGLGYLRDCDDRVYIGHSGGLPGFGSQWRFLPEYGLGIVSFANLTYAGTGSINLKVLDTIIRLHQLQPYAIKGSEILNQRKDQLVSLLPDWNINEKSNTLFAENFFPDQSLEEWKKNTTTLFNQIGKIKSIGTIRPENQLRGTFDILGENGGLTVFFTLTPENLPLIQELQIYKRQ